MICFILLGQNTYTSMDFRLKYSAENKKCEAASLAHWNIFENFQCSNFLINIVAAHPFSALLCQESELQCSNKTKFNFMVTRSMKQSVVI